MRIWIVNQYAIPPTFPGGTRHYSFARELIANGHEVMIIAGSYHHLMAKDGVSPSQTLPSSHEGVPFCWLKTPHYQGNGIGRIRNMLAFARQVAFGKLLRDLPVPDVIVGSSPHPFGAWAAGHLARKRRTAFVLEIRDLWPASIVDLGKFSPWHPGILMLGRIEKQLIKRSNGIITLLPKAHSYLASKGARPDTISWLPNGIDLQLLPKIKKPAGGSPFVIVYAGSHAVSDDLQTVLEAARLLMLQTGPSTFCFNLIGDGPQKANLQAMATKWELKNVNFYPPVSKDLIYSYLSGADAFVLSMLNADLYRFGMSFNKVYDYLAMGRPILFAGSSANDPVAEAGAGLSIPAQAPEALADAIRNLASRPLEERWEMGLKGRQHADECYDLRKLALKLETILAKAVDDYRHPKP